MKVVFVRPPIKGHIHRGTGVYFRQLKKSLKKHTDVQLSLANIHSLPRNVDIYHFPYFDPFFLTLPFIFPGPTVVTVHDLIPLRFPVHFPRGIRGELKWQVQKRLLERADAIITDSKASREDISQYTNIKMQQIHPIYLAPQEEFYFICDKKQKDDLIKKYKLPSEFILLVGEANWNKNWLNCIEATKKADVSLVIVSQSLSQKDMSDHPANKYLKAVFDLVDKNQMIFPISNLSTQDLVCLYQCAVALLFPSQYEGFGLPVVEAFAAQCPIICSNKGSLREIIGNAVYQVEPDDVNKITSAIKNVSSDVSLRQQLINEGSKQAKKFSWKKTAQQTYQVYKKVLTSR